MVQNRLVLIIYFLRAQNEKFKCMEPEPPGAAFFCLEPEQTQVGRSRRRLWDLGDLEPEPPKKVASQQHWFKENQILADLLLIQRLLYFITFLFSFRSVPYLTFLNVFVLIQYRKKFDL